MIDPKPKRSHYFDTTDAERERADRLGQQLAKAEDRARYWEAAYFDHMRDEHPEIVERVMRRIAEGES